MRMHNEFPREHVHIDPLAIEARPSTPPRIDKLSLQMLGKVSEPRLHAKAAETRHLLPFAAKLPHPRQEYKLG